MDYDAFERVLLMTAYSVVHDAPDSLVNLSEEVAHRWPVSDGADVRTSEDVATAFQSETATALFSD